VGIQRCAEPRAPCGSASQLGAHAAAALGSQANVPAPAGEVWDLVAALPERQRQVVVLRHVADLKEAQIASVLNISRSTVSTTLRDAHQRLGSLLDDGVEITHANSNLDTKETTDV